jgi:hypothetical protein
MYQPKTFNFIQGNVLSREFANSLLPNLQPARDFEKYVFDGALLNYSKPFLPGWVVEQLVLSCKDERCTKMFQHRDAMCQQFEGFFEPEKPDARHKKCVRAAVILVENYVLPEAHLHPMDYHGDGWTKMFSNKNGAAGIIAKGSKEHNIEVLIKLADKIKRMIARGDNFSSISIPTMCFHRSQISNTVINNKYNPEFNTKDRCVEGLDGGTILVESQYGKPVYDLWKTHASFYYGGKSPEKARSMVHRWKDHGMWIGSDFSKFDQHVPSWLLYECFNILKRKYFNPKYWKEIDWIAYNFVNTQMVDPNGDIVMKHHGIPSGSYFTQIVGTLANTIMEMAGLMHAMGETYISTMISRTIRVLTPDHSPFKRRSNCIGPNGECDLAMFGIGDDFLLFMYDFRLTKKFIHDMAGYITEVFGVSMSADKTDWGGTESYPVFVKREWRENGEYQNPLQIMINVVHNERRRTYENYEPVHIFYGLYLTYSEAFTNVNERMLLEEMKKSKHGIAALKSVPTREMPGVFRGLGDNVGEILYDRAVRVLGVA